MTISFKAISKPISFTGSETMSLRSIHRRYTNTDPEKNEVLNVNPDYQREHVWSEDQAADFMGHVLEGGAVPVIIINRDLTQGNPDEVVDGKQRVTAVHRWVSGEIPARLSDGREVYLKDFSEFDQRYVQSHSGPSMTFKYVVLEQKDVLDLYIRLNRGGTIHTDAEIERVRAMRAALD